jgi:DNA (cytosine-5)-methyltransferase 1
MRYASVCDGIGAAHVAWRPFGWECAWTSEIEPFPAAVVEHHWKFKNLGDMTLLMEETLNDCGPVDLLVGGTPCQSFSVAGLRGGLADPRGNLALRFVQLVGFLRPEWVVWENVPGVLSSAGGRDFGTFLGALGELGYGFAYRVLDAQWFGVAQRRRRVFVVAHARDWRRAAAVLFERESVFGNPPTRGATGQGITSSPQGIAGNVSSKWAKGTGGPAGDKCYNLVAEPHAIYSNESRCDNIPPAGLSPPLKIGSDGGGNPPCIAFDWQKGNDRTNSRPSTMNLAVDQSQTIGSTRVPAVAFTKPKRAQSNTDDETWVPGEVSPTMSCFDQGDTRATTVVAQGFTYSGYSNQPAWMTGDRTDCLPASGHSDGSHQGVGVVAFDTYNHTCGDVSQTLQRGTGTDQIGAAAIGMAVRRLTPKECERLQGFPDGYTDVTYRGKPAADGPRYRALGNSMAVPVMAWIGRRIQMVMEATNG